MLTVGLDELEGLFQMNILCDSMTAKKFMNDSGEKSSHEFEMQYDSSEVHHNTRQHLENS